jgi:DNA mismatch repair protein MutL
MLIHQQLAHERILYERFAAATNGKNIAAQRSLFPVTLQLSASDAVLLQELTTDLNQLGYLIEPFGANAFVIQGTPADVSAGNEKLAIESLLEQFKHFSSDLKFSRREKLIRSLAWQQAIKPGTSLTLEEMRMLTTDLFKCTQPNVTASGNPTFIEFKKDYLEQLFKR